MGFFKRLINDADRKVFLILDNMEDQIEVLYLPSYSPELNPYECLNADLKEAITKRAPARSKKQLKDAAIGHLRKLHEVSRPSAEVLRAQAGALCRVKTFDRRINNSRNVFHRSE